MRNLDIIFHKRLNRIRKELNAYLDSNLSITENKPSASAPATAPAEKKRGGVQEKFLSHMQLNSVKDDCCDVDYLNRPDLDKLLEQKAESFSEMLLRLIDEKDLKDSDVYKRANIDRRLFSKIRGDENYVPSKKTAIAFCLALQLEMEEAKKLLATAGYALSASSRFDLIIMYLIETKEYNIHFANIVLDDYGEGTLSR